MPGPSPSFLTSSMAEVSSHRRAVFASRFLRPPARCKRAEIREKPRKKFGPFENPVRRFVRLKEKARLFSEIPPPRRIPIPKPPPLRGASSSSLLQPLQGVPSVSPEVLQRRLDFFLLSPQRAQQQQTAAKMRKGMTPYQAELFMWHRQMTDVRKIYRAQYLQKLAEVTEEERLKQMELHVQERKDRAQRKAELRQRLYEDKKRRAILKDRLRIERKVTQSVEMARQSRRKKFLIHHYKKMENRSEIVQEDELREKLSGGRLSILTRNVLVPDLLKDLGHSTDDTLPPPPRNTKQSLRSVDNAFRHILEESFKLLPEDEEIFEDENTSGDNLTDSQRAHVMYSGFSESEKLKLLDKKIDLLTDQIDKEVTMKGSPESLMLLQLREQLEYAKHAYLENTYAQKAARKVAEEANEGCDEQLSPSSASSASPSPSPATVSPPAYSPPSHTVAQQDDVQFPEETLSKERRPS